MLELLSDFLVVAKRMNITHAARDLNMTQSNLSRRIKQLESYLGFSLLVRSDNRITLTSAGRELADGLVPILQEYDDLVARCKETSMRSPLELKVHEPPYQDASMERYIQLLERIGQRSEYVSEKYLIISRITPKECLQQGTLDIAMLHLYGDIDTLISSLDEEGFDSVHLVTLSIGAWMHPDHMFASNSILTLKQLSQCKVMSPNDVYSPMRDALLMAYKENGLEGKFGSINSKNQTEFMRCQIGNGVFVFPQDLQHDFRLSSRRDLVYVPIESDVSLEVFAIARKEDGLLI